MAIIKSPIFKDITESEISEMTAAGFLRARKFRKNSFIYHVTDSVHEIGIVASGQVTIEYRFVGQQSYYEQYYSGTCIC